MADEVERRVIYLEVNATKAVDGSTAATNALAAVGKNASSAGAAMDALEAATAAVGGASAKTAIDLATTAAAAANANTVYRTTAGGILELTKAANAAAGSAVAQAAGFARLADQRAAQASLAETRTLMDSVARSSANFAQVYGASTVSVKSLAQMQARDVSAAYDTMTASAARYVAGVEKTVQQTKVAEAYEASLRPVAQYDSVASPASPAAAARAPLTAQQKLMLGYQFNDIFTQLAGGQSPALIAAQQGPQITQVFGGIGNTLAAIPKPALVAGGVALTAVGVLAVVNAMKGLSDEADNQRRRLDALLGSQQLAASAYDVITKQAIATGTAISDVSARFSTFATATQGLGATIPQIMALSTASGQLGKIGGSTPEETAAGAAAIAKALSSSVVSADSLQAILDSMPVAARRIADGLGVSTSQLKLMAQQGDLTSQQVFTSLLGQTDKLKRDFDALPGTIGSVFHGLIIQAEDLAAKLYKSVTSFQIITDRSQQLGTTGPAKPMYSGAFGGGSANLNAPSGAFPSYPKIEQVNGEAIESDLAAGLTSQLQIAKAITDAADAAVLAGAKIASGLDPAEAAMKALQVQLAGVNAGITALANSTFDDGTKADQLDKMAAAAERLKDQIKDAGDATTQASRALGQTAFDQARDNSPAGMAIAARSRQLLNTRGNTSTSTQADDVARGELAAQAATVTRAATDAAAAQDKLTAATGRGKAAMIDAQVEVAKLSFQYQYFGQNPTADAIEAVNKFRDALRKNLNAQNTAAIIDASKPLTTDLEGIAAAMNVVTQGSYAMKRAQAEVTAARDENGTGALQMSVFDSRQNLTDAAMLADLDRQIKLTNALAAAVGDVAKQKQLQLDYDIKTAQMAAGQGLQQDLIAAELKAKALADANREAAIGLDAAQRQNDLLQQQLDIIRAGSPDMAAQLAMLQKRNDLVKAGVDLSLPANQDQINAAGTNARLQEQIQFAKDAADATKRTWQNAYDNIQSGAADTFYDIFSGAGFNAQSAATAMKNIFLRAFAEIAAAAIIKPLITPIFQLGNEAGIIPNGVVPGVTGSTGGGGLFSFLGFGGSGSASSPGAAGSPYAFANGSGASGGLGSAIGGIGRSTNQIIGASDGMFGTGTGSIFGVGGLSGLSNRPLFGGGIDSEIANWSTYGTSAQGGAGLLSSNATFGQAFGAAGGALGIGMGINSLAHSDGGAGSIIGGASSIIGGGLGIAAALMPALAATLGPIGIGIGLIGALLPSLLGGGGPKIPPMPALAYGGGAFNGSGTGYSYEGGSLGSGSSLTTAATTIADSLTKAFRAAGLTAVSGSLIGGGLGVGTAHMWDGKQWADSPYTETELRLADGTRESLTANDTSRNADQASQYLLAQTFKANVLRGGVSGAGEGLKAGLQTIDPVTTDDLNRVIALGTAYDALGKSINPAKDAIDKISASFDDLKEFATQAGLSLDPINDELKKQSVRSAQDFIDGMINPIAVQLRALQDQRDQALTSAQYIKDNIAGVTVDIDAISKHFADAISAVEAAADQPLTDFTNSLQQQVESLVPTTKTVVDTLADFNVQSQVTAKNLEETTGKIGAVSAATAAYNDLLQKTADALSSQLIQQAKQATQSPLAQQLDALDQKRDADLMTAQYLSSQMGAMKDGTSALIDQVVDTYKTLFDATTKTFRDGITEGLKAISDPLGAQLDALHAQRDQAMQDAATINDYAKKFQGTMVDMASVTALYAQQEAQVKQQYYQQTLGGLEDLVKRLTYGDLSGATALDTLSGVKGGYDAAYAAAQADPLSQDKINTLVSAASDYATEGKSYYDSTSAYFDLRQQITDALQSLDITVRSTAGNSATGAGPLTPLGQAPAAANLDPNVVALIASQQEMMSQQTQNMQALQDQNAELTRQIKNLLARPAA